MKPNLDRATCELGRELSAVTSPLSPCSVELRYPVMVSSEGPSRDNKVTDMQGTPEKSLRQWLATRGDSRKFPLKDKDEHNFQIQKKRIAEFSFSSEWVIENLEQCTEDHDCDRMNRGLANEDQCHEESEFEETEHKHFLAGRMFPSDLRSKDDQPAPGMDEKSDVEKENGETDAKEKDLREKDEEEKEIDENEIINRDGDEKEADDKEKSESEESEKDMNKKVTGKNSCDSVKSIEYYTRGDMEETIIDSGFFETELLAENPEDLQLEFIPRSEVLEIQKGLEVEENVISAEPVQIAHELMQSEKKEQNALLLVLNLDCYPEELNLDSDMFGSADSLLPAVLTAEPSATSVSSLSIEEEMSESFMGSDAIRRETLLKQLEDVLIASGAEMVPSDIQPMSFLQNTEEKWKNISNFTITRIGQEPANSEFCRVGSGDKNGQSSQGNCGNGNRGDGGSQRAACGSSKEGCLSMVGNPSSGGSGSGCGGGGDEDGDQWKKEDFHFSDSTDEKKTKQEKELKKKSRLEKGDLCSYAIVSYGNKEKLRVMALKWGERSEHIRTNSSFARHHSEGVILDSHQKEFLINQNSYQENFDWAKATGNFSPLGHGTSGKCYPCADLKTGTTFCVKEIKLLNFYDNEVTILLDLDNPGIVKMYGAIFSDDKVYILLELICGPTLQEVIDKHEKLDCITALELMRELLGLLDYLERCGVIHDDIKADNIMLREDSNSIVLIDFGLAKKGLQVLDGTVPCGSQCGMSPEKAASEGYDAKADVWAATTVLVHMISGFRPWTIKERSPPLEDVPSDTPEAVQSLIEAGWIVDAHKRPSAAQLLNCEAFLLLDTSDELIQEFDLTDEHTILETFHPEEGDELIMEAEEMLLSAGIESALNFDEAV